MLSTTPLETRAVPELDRWIDAVRAAVDTGTDGGGTAAAVRAVVGRLLADSRGVGRLTAELQAEARRRPARVLARHHEPDGPFSIQVLRWPPGWTTDVHDHLAWGVVAVLVGAEHERLFVRQPDGESVVQRAVRITEAGDCVAFVPPHDVHQVSTPEPTLALHVYGADLSGLAGSTRRRYRVADAR